MASEQLQEVSQKICSANCLSESHELPSGSMETGSLRVKQGAETERATAGVSKACACLRTSTAETKSQNGNNQDLQAEEAPVFLVPPNSSSWQLEHSESLCEVKLNTPQLNVGPCKVAKAQEQH